MKTNGFDRSLRYFAEQTEIYVLGTIGGGILMTVYMQLINGGSFTNMLNTIPATIFYVSAVVILTLISNFEQYWFPILISFGCRRKNIFWGQLFMLFLFIIETLAVYQLSGYLFNTGTLPFSFLTAFALDLAVAAVTAFFNIAMLRWGKFIYIFMVIAMVAVSMAFGMWIGFFGSSGSNPSVLLINQWPISRQLLVLGAGIALFTAANIMNYHTLKIYEVKA